MPSQVCTCVWGRNVMITILIVALLILPSLSQPACKQRQVLNDTTGAISDGTGTYQNSSYCQWLIVGGKDKYISLSFTTLYTECLYDYLFVYDGDSYDSPLLATLSGKASPTPLLAKSGYMLVYFYSDRNYVVEGFEASYTVSSCPHNCSGRGECILKTVMDPSNRQTHRCRCNRMYTGEACEIEKCPNQCSGNGDCAHGSLDKCQCNPHFAGRNCGFKFSSEATGWHLLDDNNPVFESRMGHTAAFLMKTNTFYVYGGKHMNGYIETLVGYSFRSNAWALVWEPPADRSRIGVSYPASRHEHTMVAYEDGFFILGGVTEDEVYSNDLWYFNVTTQSWTACALGSNVQLPIIAGHTMTLAHGSLYVLGGRSNTGHFYSEMYRISATEPHQWNRVAQRGGRQKDRRLVGHTTVFHQDSDLLIVFGGFTPDHARFPKRTNLLQAFHLESHVWMVLNSQSNSPSVALPVVYHSAVIMDNYMVVYGGNIHYKHGDKLTDICHDSQMYFYHLTCHKWLNSSERHFYEIGNASIPTGRFSHAADVAFGNTLLVAGGYNGKAMGDLIAYNVPMMIAKYEADVNYTTTLNHCHQHSARKNCLLDPECGWCDSHCAPRVDCMSQNRSMHTELSHCPGFCKAVDSCTSCVQLLHHPHLPSTVPRLYPNQLCHWCPKATQQQCRPVSEACESDDGPSLTWWANGGESLSSSAPISAVNQSIVAAIHACVTDDRPAGLQMATYLHPVNHAQPDMVKIISNTNISSSFDTSINPELLYDGNSSVVIHGYVHPLTAQNQTQIQMILAVKACQATLHLARNQSPTNKESIGYLSSDGVDMMEAVRPDHSDLFPGGTTAGHKYYLELQVYRYMPRPAIDPLRFAAAFSVKVEWKPDSSSERKEISVNHLELFSSEGNLCSNHTNCLSCMTDVSCGWCADSDSCHFRLETRPTMMSMCQRNYMLLITDASHCPLCADHVTCYDCLQSSLCEWVVRDARCIRAGRRHNATQTRDQCPQKCELHTTCASCIANDTECAWCEETSQCFQFSVYMINHLYGACTHWVDSVGKVTCQSCNQHTSCDTCLQHYQCGWCYDELHPQWGKCVDGDYRGPLSNGSCLASQFSLHPSLLAKTHNNTVPTLSHVSWSYLTCPDMDECHLGLHQCHHNATCINTPHGYLCRCNPHFTLDSDNNCIRTCYPSCSSHGHCSGSPHYQCVCDVGWNGTTCDTDCGCNGHSTCNNSYGACDSCLHRTEGERCQLCMDGAYGNATFSIGCMLCDCNDHGDPTQGFCDKQTGTCHCIHNTKGINCETCRSGYYGDPHNGGKCYATCKSRQVLYNIRKGAIGSRMSSDAGHTNASAHCMWILSVDDMLARRTPAVMMLSEPVRPRYHSDYIEMQHATPAHTVVPSVTLRIDASVPTQCQYGGVSVYDGIPPHLGGDDTDHPQYASSSDARLLASLCNTDESATVEAFSGTIVIYAAHRQINQSLYVHSEFNATYQVNSCPYHCIRNHHCVHTSSDVDGSAGEGSDVSECVCMDRWTGVDCTVRICPNQCGQGTCNETLGRCVCDEGYTGAACNISTNTVLQSPMLYTLPSYHSLSSTLPPISPPTVPYSLLGHTMVGCGIRQRGEGGVGDQYLYMYGGYSPRYGLSDVLWRYDAERDSWTELIPRNGARPTARHSHTSVCVTSSSNASHILMYGGVDVNNHVLDEMWRYDITHNTWTRLNNTMIGGATMAPLVPPLAGHTMTQLNNLIYIIGGYNGSIFNLYIYIYNVTEDTWSKLGGQDIEDLKPKGMYGHTAVLHAPQQVIYIYGGYFPSDDVYAPLDVGSLGARYGPMYRKAGSDHMWAFSLLTKKWNQLAPNNTQPDLSVFGHSSVGTDVYMLSFGGGGSLRGYVYECNRWIDIPVQHELDLSRVHRTSVVVSAAYNNHLHLMFFASTQNAMAHLLVPLDLCSMYNTLDECLSVPGCSACHDALRDTTRCYHTRSYDKDMFNCTSDTKHVGIQCDVDYIQSRDCGHYRSCVQCTGLLPAHPSIVGYRMVANQNVEYSRTHCHWCLRCKHGTQCISRSHECTYCEASSDTSVIINSDCRASSCMVYDCITCKAQSRCAWVNKGDADFPRYECIEKSTDSSAVANRDMGPDSCPVVCSAHTTQQVCIHHAGKTQQCVWSSSTRACLSSSAVPLACISDSCGRLVTLQSNTPCHMYTSCAVCLKQPGCGWCVKEEDNGLGICMNGGIHGPTGQARCSEQEGMYNGWHDMHTTFDPYNNNSGPPIGRSVGSENNNEFGNTSAPVWAFLTCPPENECTNGHDDCYQQTEQCLDLPVGYHCECKTGYEYDQILETCVPQCNSTCSGRGRCLTPNNCTCDFGYVGRDCEVPCECNQHSNCLSVQHKDQCLQCHNNTKGEHCELCEPSYVGTPVNGALCIACSVICNNHSDVCITKEEYNMTQFKSLMSNLKHGPATSKDAVCVACADNTKGVHCEDCKLGYFRHNNNASAPCQPCQCNGHGDSCDPSNGNHCNCQNNTLSPECHTSDTCYMRQCSKCHREYYGVPTYGHQCYYPVKVGNVHCFYSSQVNCSQSRLQGHAQYLPQGQTVYFAIQPSYLNVDIRITLDVTVGGLTVYFAPTPEAFVVYYDQYLGEHKVSIDPTYDLRYRDPPIERSDKDVLRQQRRVRDTGRKGNNSSNAFWLERRNATELNTFITLPDPNTILIVENLENRLVVHLPSVNHDLKHTQFFLVLYGTGSTQSSVTSGQLFARQDQPRIDLFVFFSVFFSCFFLFLALCVLLWKLKQAHDVRRSRQRRKIEMEHLRNRASSSVVVMFDGEVFDRSSYSYVSLRKRSVDRRLRRSSSGHSKGRSVMSPTSPTSAVGMTDLSPTHTSSVVTIDKQHPTGGKATYDDKPHHHHHQHHHSDKRTTSIDPTNNVVTPISPSATVSAATRYRGSGEHRHSDRQRSDKPSSHHKNNSTGGGISSGASDANSYKVALLAAEPLSDGHSAVATVFLQLPCTSQVEQKACLASALVTTRGSGNNLSTLLAPPAGHFLTPSGAKYYGMYNRKTVPIQNDTTTSTI